MEHTQNKPSPTPPASCRSVFQNGTEHCCPQEFTQFLLHLMEEEQSS